MSTDEILRNALRQMLSCKGSGASVDDPRRLGRIHPLLAPEVERVLIKGVYGDEGHDWFDGGRHYHKKDSICEQLIRVGENPKPKWAAPGRTYSMFFEISELTDSAPVPDELRKAAAEASLKMSVPDASFTSRFPLAVIKARDAKEAARTIAGYLAQAKDQGWSVFCARALLDDWRNEYDLTKDSEKTVFRFDMRPMLASVSRLELVALTLLSGTPDLETVITNYASTYSWPEAFAEAGLSFIDTSRPKSESRSKEPVFRSRLTSKVQSRSWYYYEGGQKKGPVSEDEIISLIERGTISKMTVARPTDDDMSEGGYLVELLQERGELPRAERVFPPLPPNARDAHRIVRSWEVKFGRLVSEMSAHQISEIVHSDPFCRGQASIEYFRGTDIEAILRSENRKYHALCYTFGVGIATGIGVGFLAQSVVIGLAAAFALGIILLGIGTRLVH